MNRGVLFSQITVLFCNGAELLGLLVLSHAELTGDDILDEIAVAVIAQPCVSLWTVIHSAVGAVSN